MARRKKIEAEECRLDIGNDKRARLGVILCFDCHARVIADLAVRDLDVAAAVEFADLTRKVARSLRLSEWSPRQGGDQAQDKHRQTTHEPYLRSISCSFHAGPVKPLNAEKVDLKSLADCIQQSTDQARIHQKRRFRDNSATQERNRMPSELTLSDTTTWPDLAVGLYDALTGRGAEIVYDFENFELLIPSSTSPDATHARWRMNGVIKIRTRDNSHG